MKEKKNIERLFQEKFKDFEAVPPPKIWNNIEAELQKKKRRKAIPIWFKLSGAAAVLIISFLIGYGLLPSRTDESTDIVKQDNNVPENRKNQVIIKNHIKNDEAVADAGQPEKEKTRNPDAGLEEENTLESEKNQVLKNKQKETAIAGEETKNAKASSLAKKDLKKKEETIFTNNAANRNT
ncbi:MAG TPA: hypothetical protein VFR70_10240, partial [Flavobacterium sp.]|nr:hypothetical protein [Flavobacterium sp.]